MRSWKYGNPGCRRVLKSALPGNKPKAEEVEQPTGETIFIFRNIKSDLGKRGGERDFRIVTMMITMMIMSMITMMMVIMVMVTGTDGWVVVDGDGSQPEGTYKARW